MLFRSTAMFGVTVYLDPYPAGTYVGILGLANHYVVEVQAIVSGVLSAWSAPLNFDTFLPCPAISTAPVFTPDSMNSAQITFSLIYNAYGSTTYPTLYLNYKKSSSMVYTQVPYPLNNSELTLILPGGPGTYAFYYSSQCEDTSSVVVSPIAYYTF